MDVKTHSELVEIHKQIGELSDIVKKLTQMVKDNRIFIEKNAELGKKMVDVLETLSQYGH